MSDSPNALPLRQRKPLRISTDLSLFTPSLSDSSSSSSSPPNQSVTPRTTPSTGIPQFFFHVLCMHDFESSDPVHLPFHKDEVLIIIKQEHSGWWAAMRAHGDHIGWIPSAFVLPLNKSKFVEYPDEPLCTFESLSNSPLSAAHDPWVPVSEDCTALSFRLVTPTDLIPCKGFLDDRPLCHDFESFFSQSNDERFSDTEDVRILSPCKSPPPHRVQRPHFTKPFLPESRGSQPIRPASPSLPDAGLHHHSRLCRTGDLEASFRYLATPVSPHETSPEFLHSLDIKTSLVPLKSVAVSENNTHSDSGIDGQSQCLGLLTNFRPAGPDWDIPLLELAIRGPDDLAEQLCVLMHTLYATVHQNDCLDWVAGRKHTNLTGLRHLFDTHDYIASWVQRSMLVCDDITRQAETLDFWIRVAEKCHALRNFDSLCAIILALSESSLESAWAHKETIATLHSMLDTTNQFSRLMDIMDAVEGPSVPFVRRYLEHIKALHVEHTAEFSPQSRYTADASSLCKMQLTAVSSLLRHQSSPYDFKITKPVRSFIDNMFRTASQ